GVGLGRTTPIDVTWVDTQPDHNGSVHLDWAGTRATLRFEHGFSAGTYSDEPTPPNTRQAPPYIHFDLFTGIPSGNVSYEDSRSERHIYSAAIAANGRARIGGGHAVKAGIQQERGRAGYTYGYPGGRRYLDKGGAPYQVVFMDEDHQDS